MQNCSTRISVRTMGARWTMAVLVLALAGGAAGARQASAPATAKAGGDDAVYVTARLYPNAQAQAAAEAAAKAQGKPGAKAAREPDATAATAPGAKSAAAAAASSSSSTAAGASTPKRATPPRRAVRQQIATMPDAPRPQPGDTYRPGPSPLPPAVVLAPPAPVQLIGCDGGGCNGADGKRYNGTGAAVINPQGRLCNRNGSSVQCF
jgi:hypothetical protein